MLMSIDFNEHSTDLEIDQLFESMSAVISQLRESSFCGFGNTNLSSDNNENVSGINHANNIDLCCSSKPSQEVSVTTRVNDILAKLDNIRRVCQNQRLPDTYLSSHIETLCTESVDTVSELPRINNKLKPIRVLRSRVIMGPADDQDLTYVN